MTAKQISDDVQLKELRLSIAVQNNQYVLIVIKDGKITKINIIPSDQGVSRSHFSDICETLLNVFVQGEAVGSVVEALDEFDWLQYVELIVLASNVRSDMRIEMDQFTLRPNPACTECLNTEEAKILNDLLTAAHWVLSCLADGCVGPPVPKHVT